MTDVCQLLKDTRIGRGLSLEEVASRTYIKIGYLEALEEGWLERLPAPVHTFGYIRMYSKMLGLDGGALVAQFQQQRGLGVGGIPTPRSSGPLTSEWSTRAAVVPGADQRDPINGNGNTLTQGTSDHDSTVVTGGASSSSSRGISLGQLIASAATGSRSAPSEAVSEQEGRQAKQVIAAAEREAQQLVRGAETYADGVLATLESEIDKALQIVRNGRQFLQVRRQAGTPGN